MGCVIKLQIGKGYKIFNSEDELKNYIADHIDEFREWKFKRKDADVKDNVLRFADNKLGKTQVIADIIRDANQDSYEATKGALTESELDDFDREHFKTASDALSMSELLKAFVGEENKRLFPEFIVKNYLSILTLDTIIKELYNINGNNGLTEARRKIINALEFELATKSEDAKYINAEE